MNKDRALEELFLANKPQFDDKEAFMTSLTKRLDAVEYIKQYQEATIRRYKMAVVVAFFAGLVVGGIAIAYLLASPSDTPLFNFDTHNIYFLEWLCGNSRIITVSARWHHLIYRQYPGTHEHASITATPTSRPIEHPSLLAHSSS